MSNKRKIYTGKVELEPFIQIYLNINHLAKGIYTLKITHENKVIKQTTFKK